MFSELPQTCTRMHSLDEQRPGDCPRPRSLGRGSPAGNVQADSDRRASAGTAPGPAPDGSTRLHPPRPWPSVPEHLPHESHRQGQEAQLFWGVSWAGQCAPAGVGGAAGVTEPAGKENGVPPPSTLAPQTGNRNQPVSGHSAPGADSPETRRPPGPPHTPTHACTEPRPTSRRRLGLIAWKTLPLGAGAAPRSAAEAPHCVGHHTLREGEQARLSQREGQGNGTIAATLGPCFLVGKAGCQRCGAPRGSSCCLRKGAAETEKDHSS